MSSIEFEQLVAQLKANAIDLAKDPSGVREDFSVAMNGLPLLENFTHSARTIAGVPGIWGEGPWSESERVLLYLHGGAYVFGSARDYLSLAANLAHVCQAKVFAADYRLAPEHPYPAAVEDAVAAYQGLLAEGYLPAQVVVAGDSAGGGLTIAMLLAARDAGLPMPAAAVTFSPWADLTLSGDSMESCADADYLLTRCGLAGMADLYLASHAPTEPLISPIRADLTGLPPLLIQVGSHEVLLSDAIRLAERAGLADVEVELQVWPKMFHVWHMFAFALDSSREALNRAGNFLRERSIIRG